MKTRHLLAAFGAATALFGTACAHAQDTQAKRVWLREHNEARAAFGSAPLRWSADLEREAREWAERLARENRLRHASPEERGGKGENLWMGTHGFFRPSQMIVSFVEERRDFVAGRFPAVSRTGRWSDVGHYTQIVWPQRREVGCALAANTQFDTMVCRYWPSGNRMGERIAPRGPVAKR